MTRKERMVAALRREPVDTIPFATYNLHPYPGGKHAGDTSYAELLALVEAKAGMYCKRNLRSAQRTERDAANASKVAAYDTGAESTRTVEHDGDQDRITTTLHTPKGDLRSVRIQPKNKPGMVVEHFVKTDDDIERYLSIPWQPAEYDVSPLVEFQRHLGDRGITTVGYNDPMYAAASLFDFQDFCLRYATDPGSLLRMIDHFFEQIAEDTRRKAEACRGLDVVFLTGGPEVATPPMMPPRAFKELVVPSQKKLIRIIHDAGHMAMIHCHGRVGHVLDFMMETGVDAIEPVEPPPQGDIGLKDLLDRTSGRMAMLGHIQDQDLHHVPPGTMARHVEAVARIADGRTGYILAPTCTPFEHPATPTYIRNYIEWTETAARVFGGA
jgi:uroporphyrinogen-III decarboxylase